MLMKKEELVKEVNLFFIIAIIFILVFLFLKPTITGFITFTPGSYNWTFENPNNYVYDENLILIENNSAQLKLQQTTYNWTTTNSSEFYIVTAYYDGNDKTDKIISLDNNHQDIGEDKLLDITFENNIENNDIITLYLKKEKISNISLCNISISCEENYGSLNFPNIEGWYNITVENLSSPTNNLAILANEKTKIDHIKVLKETEIIHYGTNSTYPENASLETSNINLPSNNNLNLFSKNQELNQQEINYYYSTDNGITWNLIPSNGSLPSNLDQIKIKSEFITDTTNTPILYDISLNYQYCIEDWECNNWTECYENNTKSRICTDLNDCNTFDNRPEEIQNCTYIPPCEENWSCSSWSNCINENQIRNCTDLNECGTFTNKPEEIQNCTIESSGTTTTTTSPGGEGAGGSRTFTRPIEKTTIEESIPKATTETESEEKEETPPGIEPVKIEQKNPLQKFTGFVSYNLGEEGINLIVLSIFILLVVFLIKKFKKKN